MTDEAEPQELEFKLRVRIKAPAHLSSRQVLESIKDALYLDIHESTVTDVEELGWVRTHSGLM